MINWDEYVTRFYSWPPDVQSAEWAKLTAEQRSQFEAARGRMNANTPPAGGSNTRHLMIGCLAILLIAISGLVGLSILGNHAGRQASPVATSHTAPISLPRSPAAATAEVDRLAKDKTQSILVLRKARLVIEAFPDSPEATHLKELLPALESAAQAQERQQEQENARAGEAERLRLAALKWSYSTTSDEMTSRKTHTATIESENTVNFDFPYAGEQRATLILRTPPELWT